MAEELKLGIFVGLGFATILSLFVLVMAVLRGSTVYESMGALNTWQIIAFYYAAGVLGGSVHGLLAPLRDRYVGKLLNAYLLLLIVYGGATTAFWPMFTADQDPGDPVTIGQMWLVWLVLALPLSPIYVKIFDD